MGLRTFPRTLPAGETNTLCDVPGVRVGHTTLSGGHVQTGVTAIIPAPGDLFAQKLSAGASVFNGFGKSAGLVQLQELGTLESPIVLTNTFSVGTALTALTRYMLGRNPSIGREAPTVNCVVCECNDGRVNDIRGMLVREEHVLSALESASGEMEEGTIGAGTGMVCFGLSGGIGSSSRLVTLGSEKYTLGALVLANYGSRRRLRYKGELVFPDGSEEADRGSVIIVLGTDIPLSSRQLRRVSARASMALGRSGSVMGGGSGDIALAFSTALRIPQEPQDIIACLPRLQEAYLETVFVAAVESTEEAVYSALFHAKAKKTLNGETIHSLKEYRHD